MTKRGRMYPSYEGKVDQPMAITPIEYSGLQEAYDHFNAALFEGSLAEVFMTYQRRAHSPRRAEVGRAARPKQKAASRESAVNSRRPAFISSLLLSDARKRNVTVEYHSPPVPAD